MAEEDRVDVSEEVNPPVSVNSQPPSAHAPPPPTPASVLPAYSGALPMHLLPPTSSRAPLPRVSLTSSASDDHASIAALEGAVNQLVASMTTNMAELFALLRRPNRASSSSTPPSRQGPTIDPTSWIPPTQVLEATDAPAPPTTHTSTVHPFTSPFPPPPAPAAVPLPTAAFLSSKQALSAPPPISMPAPAAVYTVPPSMVFPASNAPAPTHLQIAELPPYPSLQPHVGLSYQAPPPINTTFLEPGRPTHAAQFASPTHFLPEVDAEQERRLKRMEETIRALQANEARPEASYGDCSLFLGMRLPSKFKIPEFKTYEGEGESEQGCPSPFMIEYVPAETAVGFTRIDASPTPFVIDVLAREPYSDDKVPWTYEGGVGSLEEQFCVMGITRSGRVYENPAATNKGKAPTAEIEKIPGVPPTPPKEVTEGEAEAFMKIIKASEYKVVEQMAKSPTHISLLAFLLSSEPHREALLRILTAAQDPKGTSPDWIEETINSIFSNTVSSALNVCPVTTLKQMNVDLNRVRPSKIAVRAFDGSRREVNWDIDLLIDVGPCSFSVTFQVLDIPNAFSLLLGRPWIHSVGAIPSSLHQKLKFFVKERIITVKGEEDYAIYKETAVPYISVGNDENLPFYSFETISVIQDYGEVGQSRADRMIGKVLLRHNYIPGTGLGARGQGINCPIEIEEYKHRRGLGFRPSCHEIIEAPSPPPRHALWEAQQGHGSSPAVSLLSRTSTHHREHP
ncbi:hypothetical protein CRG98_006150 [Punica granatum]|uniref:G-patch domain-containing protein n=1 Tax=Punica granatum TaxID=22663 RepID=A0A2I0KYA1_PUNGR|nr:hypothetical protein CRG98_006150 [Punica granatum]